MIEDNGIRKVKLFDADPYTLNALAGTDIEVMLGIPNCFSQNLSEQYSTAQAWVKQNVTAYLGKGGVNIRYVAVGNEPFLTNYNGSFTSSTFPAMKNIRKALNEAGVVKQIKVSTALNGDVYDPRFPREYAFFDNQITVDENGIEYHNDFDKSIDTLVAALQKAKAPAVPVIVGEVGWPTDGDFYSTRKNGQRFYNGLIKKMVSNEGTPRRPNKNSDVYMFCLLDEDFKNIDPGMCERHWGIFSFDGQPKFPMDLSGKGENKSLVGAKGVPYLARQWCVHNKEANNQEDLAKKVEYASNNTDCTSLVAGASCSGMGTDMNASVAFNMYYQMQDQAEGACDFQGLAKLVKRDPSIGTCQFPIMIEKYQATHPPGAPNSKSASGPSGSDSDSPGLRVAFTLAVYKRMEVESHLRMGCVLQKGEELVCYGYQTKYVNAVIVCEFRIDTGNIFASQVADESAQAEVSSVGLRCLASARLPLSLLVGWHLKKNLFAMELCVLTKKVFLAGVGVLLSNEGLVKLRNVPPLLDRNEGWNGSMFKEVRKVGVLGCCFGMPWVSKTQRMDSDQLLVI
ncbi:O-Glycosyl hydrolases family 17 protein [Theobroma cacao]|uniref:glucan endo-1,3-beta-D-glucosidase n=1 Tax=Theobroma cacao TaxID=3641 RepID=A0A061DJY9_THECC|nr:O-Glycosyl hydrolases family 17 protein [Theobroma cacao]